MAWWRPEEEPSPQERIGARPRTGATSRPSEEDRARPAPVRQPRRRRRRQYGGFPYNTPFAIAALVFVAAFTIPVIVAFTAVDFGGGGGGSGFGTGSRDGPSLVPADRFDRAWGKVRDAAGPEDSLAVLRVAPERVDAIVSSPGGERRSIQVWPDLSVMEFPAGSGGSDDGLSLRRFDTALPDRLVRRAAERLGVARDAIDYLAFAAHGGSGSWSVFFDGGRYVVADLDGSSMRVPGQ
jgi:hypothetical protein